MVKATNESTELSRAVHRLRTMHRMSMREFALAVYGFETRKSTVSLIELGRWAPSDDLLQPIADYANVTVQELREGKLRVDTCKTCNGSGVA